MERKTVKLLGINIDTFGFEDAVEYTADLIKTQKGGQIVTINPEMIETALKSPYFEKILNNADLVIPDGVGVKIGLNIKGFNLKRIAGIEFSTKLLEECSKNHFSIALIGAKSHVLKKAVQILKSEFKELNIVYTQDGYFNDTERVLTELKEKSPQFVLVALGSPKQEEFIFEARKILPQALMIGVGGSFDVWSGEVQRAPEIYQKLGLEWLYRTTKEPWRLKRIFPTLPKFFLRVLLSRENVKRER
ncbi:MAG: WecB/TagA/CpsF family glycosyltransferase [Candidatus Gastranaerophilales bacterium]|nr:WecB/TagA/CpsF family glycosyltransferase [Candidatus Gastranaerophilales bacterium]